MTTLSLSLRAFHKTFCAIGVLSTIALLATIATAQDRNSNPSPTFPDVPYGTHERHVLDFWKAESDTPTPVVIFIHGGGFTGGTKNGVKEEMLKDLLAAKISVAAIHYQLLDDAPLPAAHDDAVQALQFLRSKAAAWNIDKTRMGAFGSSAGAQLCMYLAFHDDRAEPASTDPVARESSRLTCVATLRGQTTMNTELWLKWIPGYDAPHRDPYKIFGVKTKTEYLRKVSEVSALDLVSADDPPIYMKYKMAPEDPVSFQIDHAFADEPNKVQLDGIEFKLPAGLALERAVPESLVKWPVVVDWDCTDRRVVVEAGGAFKPIVESNKRLLDKIVRLEDTDGDGIFEKRILAEDELPFTEGEIDMEQPGEVSIMPTGMMEQLTNQELANLLAVLKNAK